MFTLSRITSILLLAFQSLFTQATYQWTLLKASPVQSGRYEDIKFITPQQGWAVSGASTIIMTNNGGETWETLQAVAPYKVYFRSLALINSTKAFIGTLNSIYPLIVTSNSGKKFSPVVIKEKQPTAICGMYQYKNSIYGVGAYFGNATFIRSQDSGANWIGIDMMPYANSLVDCYFFNDSVGLTIGSVGGTSFGNGNSVVLRTTNRGNSWETVYKSERFNEWGWKLFFINDSVGYASIERMQTTVGGIYYIKTTDRGMTWSDHYFLKDYDVEGIGFWNENTGWIGGWTGPTYQTLDGGTTWKTFTMSNTMYHLNRIRKINDTLMYGAGTQIYRYSPSLVAAVEREETKTPITFFVAQNYPNPFNPNTTIEFTLAEASIVRVNIYNSIGQLVEGIMDNPKPAGTYRLQWRPSPELSGGVYFYQVQTETQTVTHSMLYLK
ncbi:MAG: YCF48-related protein [Bacteriovoracaceae bacterium]